MIRQPVELEALLEHGPWLRRLAGALAGVDGDADDLVQEAWLAALRSPPEPGRAARPWLGQVLRNAWRMRRRAAGRRRAREADGGGGLQGPTAGPHEVVERAEIQRRLANMVMDLDEPYRTALLLRYFEGKQAKDIARVLGVPAGTVRWRVSEGLSRLRTELDREAAGERERWRCWMLSLAEPPGGASGEPSRGAPLGWRVGLASTAAAVALIGAGVLVARRSGAAVHQVDVRAVRSLDAIRAPGDEASNPTQPKEEEIMRIKQRQVAAFFALAVPALVASAETGGSQLTHDEQVAFCVRRWEKMAACKEGFAEYFAGKMPPERREAHRRRFLTLAEEAGTGPLEPRQQKCAEMVDRVRPRQTTAEVSKIEACFAATDCKAMLACMAPIMDSGPTKPPGL